MTRTRKERRCDGVCRRELLHVGGLSAFGLGVSDWFAAQNAMAAKAGGEGVAGLSAPRLVIATGGPSIPKMGATGIAYDIARHFGLGLVSPRPALVPLTLGSSDDDLKGIPGTACPAAFALPAIGPSKTWRSG